MGYKAVGFSRFVSYQNTSNLSANYQTSYYRLNIYGNEFDSPDVSTVTTLSNDDNIFHTNGHKNEIKKYETLFSDFEDGENSVAGSTMRYITITLTSLDSRFRFYGGYIHLDLI